jgi:hypothetical protein
MSTEFCVCTEINQKPEVRFRSKSLWCGTCNLVISAQNNLENINSNTYEVSTDKRLLKEESLLSRNSVATLEDVVKAQNRTTHAVRAFVRFLFIQLSSVTLAVFLWNVSIMFVDESKCYNLGRNCSGNSILQICAFATLVIGLIWSSNAGWNELSKSEVK